MTDAAVHGWWRARLAARRAGLLTESEEQRFDRHLAECDECRSSWEATIEKDAGAGTGHSPGEPHIPPAMLARWETARAELRGLERAMVREHLETCAECRQDLEVLGFEATLERVPDWEWAGERGLDPAEGSKPRHDLSHQSNVGADRSRVDIRILRPAPKRDWGRWAFGGWATVATAAALVLVLNPGAVHLGGRSMTPDSSLSPTPIPEPPRALGLTVVGPPISLRPGTRGAAIPSPVALEIDSLTTLVPLVIEPLYLPPAIPVDVTVRNEAGNELVRTTIPNRELRSGRLLLSNGGAPLQPGQYAVHLRGGPAPNAALPEPEEADYHFELRLRSAGDDSIATVRRR